MPPGDDAIVLVCSCGRRLRAPGARPGRVGRCPSCGATLTAPGAVEPTAPRARRPIDENEVAAPAPPPKERRPRRERAEGHAIPVGASGPGEDDHDEVMPERTRATDSKLQELSDAARQVGRGGVVPLPRSSTFGVKDALLYPIWDGAGLASMVAYGAVLTFTSLVVFGMIPMVMKGGNMLLFGPFAFPFAIVFALAMGYLFQILEAVITSSAAGEVHHPRWPDVEFGAIVAELFLWAIALVLGLGLGSVPALAYLQGRAEPTLADHLIAAVLLASGLGYGLMSLASTLLHGDLMAANPVTVVKGIVRGGSAYVRVVLLAVAASAVGTLVVEGLYRIEGFWILLPATWLAWMVLVYLLLAVSRALGMCCNARSRQLKWFPDRPRWGA